MVIKYHEIFSFGLLVQYNIKPMPIAETVKHFFTLVFISYQ